MNEWKVVTRVERNNGKPGFFWRDGERWLRTGKLIQRVSELAPHLEGEFMRKLDAYSDLARLNSIEKRFGPADRRVARRRTKTFHDAMDEMIFRCLRGTEHRNGGDRRKVVRRHA